MDQQRSEAAEAAEGGCRLALQWGNHCKCSNQPPDYILSCEHFVAPHTEGADPPVRAVEFCLEAAELVSGDREAANGDKSINFKNIADLWNGWMRISIRTTPPGAFPLFTPRDVGELMELFKIARRHSGSYNPDDYVDAAGYAGCTGEIAAKEHAERPT